MLLTAIAGALIMWFLFPEATIMGASGVLFCMMMLASFASVRRGAIPITLILVIILYLGSEVLQAVTGTAGLTELTHIAGGVVGLLLGFWLGDALAGYTPFFIGLVYYFSGAWKTRKYVIKEEK